MQALSSNRGAPFLQLLFMGLFMATVVLLFYAYCYVGEQLSVQVMKNLRGPNMFSCAIFILCKSKFNNVGI